MAQRLIFMGSDEVALPALNWIAGDAGRAVAEIVAVYTQPDRPSGRGQKLQPNAVKTWALERELPVLQPEKLTPDELVRFRAFKADAALVMAYGHILRQDWIDAPRCGIWNLHASLLPRHRGASPIQGAIASGDKESGVTLMRIVPRLDAGPMLDAEKVRLDVFETAATLEQRLAACCVPLLERNFRSLFDSSVETREQDEDAVTFTRRLRKADGALDFHAPAHVLARRINALHPWPGAFFPLREETIKVGLAEPSTREDATAAPGTVLDPDPDAVVLATGAGSLRLIKLQRPGGRMLPAAEFLRGHPLEPGTIIDSAPMTELVSEQPLKR